ncbi:MAG: hypothetical protein ABI661_01405 [Gammaproteobacteria bacterium]
MRHATRWTAVIAGVSLCLGLGAGLARAADPVADEAAVAKDLTAVIALQSLPCGQVLRAAKQGDNDYLATCQDGNRYRVTVNPEGRVVVTKQ